MKDSFHLDLLVVKENSSTFPVIFSKEPGIIIRQMEKVFTQMAKERSMMEIGKKTSNMEKVLKHGSTTLKTKVAINLVKNKDKAFISGQTVLNTTESGKKTRLMAWAYTYGMMEENIMDPG